MEPMISNALEHRGVPSKLTPLDRARLTAAIAAGRGAALASRLSGRGSGASIRGHLMLRLDPTALGKLLAGRRIAAVSGTNGKTTTTHLLAAAVRQALSSDSHRLVTNADGANLHHGIASALSQHPKADLAVLETDERVVADLVGLGKPEVLVLLNFSRDQLDRNHEIKSLARSWRDSLAAAGEDGPVVVANAEEPLVVWAAQGAKRVVWIDTSSTWVQDAALCPECNSNLVRSEPAGTLPGMWSCTGCELREPPAVFTVSDDDIVAADGRSWTPALNLPGKFNIGNAACALAAAELLGVDPADAILGMRQVIAPAGRFATTTFGDTTARLLLAKNPAGWAEALPIANTETIVLAIDALAADGRDLSWLWDVEYEQLAGKTVIATGPRAQDLAVRLFYAGVEHRVVPELEAALAGHRDPVDVIATYTPFQRLRKMGGLT